MKAGVSPNFVYQKIYESNSVSSLVLQSKVLSTLELVYDQQGSDTDNAERRRSSNAVRHMKRRTLLSIFLLKVNKLSSQSFSNKILKVFSVVPSVQRGILMLRKLPSISAEAVTRPLQVSNVKNRLEKTRASSLENARKILYIINPGECRITIGCIYIYEQVH